MSGRGTRYVLLALAATAFLGCGEGRSAPPRDPGTTAAPVATAATLTPIPDSAFARLHRELSGPGAYFDTDNLISNEDSYLHAVDALRASGLSGGVYMGVGPDQNYAYVAALRPELALIIDIRRDNALLHLLFKVVFEAADDRQGYLCMLLGRACPDRASAGWTVGALLDSVDGWPRAPDGGAALRAELQSRLRHVGIPLSDDDLATIDRFHRRFITEGLELRFNTHGRAPNPYYPTLRRLLLETDRSGRRAAYLAEEASFRTVKALHEANRIVPVVGDLGGDVALPGIARWLRTDPPALHDPRLTAFYTSNVEFYLRRDGGYDTWIRNLHALPRHDGALLIRSIFNRGRPGNPSSLPGYYSTQETQLIRPQ